MASVNKVICPGCNNEYFRTNKQINQVIKRTGSWQCKACSNAKNGKKRAKDIGSTRIHLQSGYVEEKTELGWVRQHIVVMENYIGRRLLKNEAVHHLNEIKTDNRIENLMLMNHGEHTSLHHSGVKRTALQAKRIRDGVRKSKNTKLSIELAQRIREMFADKKISQREIAKNFGVSPMAVNQVVHNKTWR